MPPKFSGVETKDRVMDSRVVTWNSYLFLHAFYVWRCFHSHPALQKILHQSFTSWKHEFFRFVSTSDLRPLTSCVTIPLDILNERGSSRYLGSVLFRIGVVADYPHSLPLFVVGIHLDGGIELSNRPLTRCVHYGLPRFVIEIIVL